LYADCTVCGGFDYDGAMGQTTGQGDWADWPIIQPIGIIQGEWPVRA